MSRRSTPREIASEVTPSRAEQIRLSDRREQRLKAYVEGLLPPHLETQVDVVVTPFITTAAVLPATAEALLDAEETDIPPAQARQLVERVDGEYLILVTGQPAPTDIIPGDDQITADKAHQFGLVFHETLHILKTAIESIAELLAAEVDDEYEDLVHDLFNAIEDGAIEGEAIEGSNFSDNAGVRLGFTRRIHSQFPEDLDEDAPEFSFWDAVTTALYEYAIYPTGIIDVLMDPDDPRARFTSDADRAAFHSVDAELEQLADEALAIRSSERDDVSHRHDKEASIKRAKRVLQTWHEVLKPLLEDGVHDNQSAQQQPPGPQSGEQEAERDDAARTSSASEPVTDSKQSDQSADTPDADPAADETAQPRAESTADADHEEGDDTDQATTAAIGPATDPDTADGTIDPAEGDIDPEDITTDREATDDPFQDALDRPAVDTEDDLDPDDVDLDEADVRPSPADDGTGSDDDPGEEGNETGADGTGRDITEESAPDHPAARDDTDSNASDGDPAAGDQTTGNLDEPGDAETPAEAAGQDSSGGRSDDPDTEPTPEDDGGAESEADPPDPTAESGAGGDETTQSGSKAEDLASHTADADTDADDGGQLTIDDFAGGASGRATGADDDTDDVETGPNSGSRQESSPTGGTDRADSPTSDPSSEADDSSGTSPDGKGDAGGEDDAAESSPTTSDDDTETDRNDRTAPTSASAEGGTEEPGDSTRDPSSGPETGDGDPAENDGNAGGDSTKSTGREDSPQPHTSGDAAEQAEGERSKDDIGADDESQSTEQEPGRAPAHGGDGDPELDLDTLETDPTRERRAADASTVDEQALTDELEALERQLDDECETENEASTPGDQEETGSGAGPGSLEELTVLPQSDDPVEPSTWQGVATGADQVGDTLAKELQLDRQSATRRGLTSGSYDSSQGHKLSYGDPGVFKRQMPGDEKRYALVIVLDRSGSMGNGSPPKIETATAAVARFAVAAEELGIEVAVIDFYRNEARLVKPFSVDVEHAQGALLADDTGGGTPLADGLALARDLIRSRSAEPLLVTMTDDRPRSVEAVSEEIRAAYAPVCSLTIATDCRRGQPPATAERLERQYDRTATVFDPERLDDRLDQFASLLAGY